MKVRHLPPYVDRPADHLFDDARSLACPPDFVHLSTRSRGRARGDATLPTKVFQVLGSKIGETCRDWGEIAGEIARFCVTCKKMPRFLRSSTAGHQLPGADADAVQKSYLTLPELVASRGTPDRRLLSHARRALSPPLALCLLARRHGAAWCTTWREWCTLTSHT